MGLYSRTRQQQLVNFRSVISDVYEGRLFVSGAAAACNLEVMRTGIDQPFYRTTPVAAIESCGLAIGSEDCFSQ